MRKPLGQLFLSLVLSVIGSLVLLFLLPSFGMEPSVGSETEAGVVIAIVILVLLYAMGVLQSLPTVDSNRFPQVRGKRARSNGSTPRKVLALSHGKMVKMCSFTTARFAVKTATCCAKVRSSAT